MVFVVSLPQFTYSNLGRKIVIIDNLSRKKIDIKLGVNSLTPIASVGSRLCAWKKISGKTIPF
jgi:UDP-sulfoquinovose synthase